MACRTPVEVKQRPFSPHIHHTLAQCSLAPDHSKIPFSEKMQVTVHGECIKFIFITMITGKVKWLKPIQADELNTPSVQHYLLVAKSDLVSCIKVPSIPRYVLNDREGVPTSLNTVRPSAPNALPSITQLSK